MTKASVPFDNSAFIEDLKDPAIASEYLGEVLKYDDMELFKKALDNVAKAQGGYTKLARKTGLNRQNLHRTLSSDKDPRLSTIAKILPAFGVQLTTTPVEAA